MRGATSFSSHDGAPIRDLLTKLRRVERAEQKAIRATLRQRFGFFITDFDQSLHGFTRSDFDALVARGTITIHD